MAKVSSGSRWQQLGPVLVVGGLLVACSSGQPAVTSSRFVRHSEAASSAIRAVHSCLASSTPSTWRALLGVPGLPPQKGLDLSPLAVAGHFAFGQVYSGSSSQLAIGEGNLLTGQVTEVAPLPVDASGLGAVGADLPWIVWEEGDSQYNEGDWSLHSWDQETGVSRVLETSQEPSGATLAGAPPTPVVWDGMASWVEPTTTNGQAKLLVVDLATGKSRTLAAGGVGGPVLVGPYLVWTQEQSAQTVTFRAVFARNLRPATLPRALQGTQSVSSLSGSSTYLAWGTDELAKLMVWKVGSKYREEFAPAVPKDGSPNSSPLFQFLVLAGPYVLWNTGIAALTMDLKTGKGFVEIGGDAGVATGSSQWLVAVGAPPIAGRTTAFAQTWIVPLRTASAPPVDSCG